MAGYRKMAKTYWASFGSVEYVGEEGHKQFMEGVRTDLKAWSLEADNVLPIATRLKQATKRFQELVGLRFLLQDLYAYALSSRHRHPYLTTSYTRSLSYFNQTQILRLAVLSLLAPL